MIGSFLGTYLDEIRAGRTLMKEKLAAHTPSHTGQQIAADPVPFFSLGRKIKEEATTSDYYCWSSQLHKV